MYFESNRSSRDGMVAVGSVVMNRVESGQYPRSVCGVVGQRGQFAPGIMSRRMDSRSLPLVRETAQSVLQGERDERQPSCPTPSGKLAAGLSRRTGVARPGG